MSNLENEDVLIKQKQKESIIYHLKKTNTELSKKLKLNNDCTDKLIILKLEVDNFAKLHQDAISSNHEKDLIIANQKTDVEELSNKLNEKDEQLRNLNNIIDELKQNIDSLNLSNKSIFELQKALINNICDSFKISNELGHNDFQKINNITEMNKNIEVFENTYKSLLQKLDEIAIIYHSKNHISDNKTQQLLKSDKLSTEEVNNLYINFPNIFSFINDSKSKENNMIESNVQTEITTYKDMELQTDNQAGFQNLSSKSIDSKLESRIELNNELKFDKENIENNSNGFLPSLKSVFNLFK